MPCRRDRFRMAIGNEQPNHLEKLGIKKSL